ncbi:DhNV_064 [Dikerogammarus haemobaphes nudivirus]|nr:DhNV_064 [Dikerogammarus haemobaphes nudivirus]
MAPTKNTTTTTNIDNNIKKTKTIIRKKKDDKQKKPSVQQFLQTIKVPVDIIIEKLQKDEDLEKHLSQDDINFIITLIHKTEFPSHIHTAEELIDCITKVAKTYLKHKNTILTLSCSVITKYISSKIKKLIIQYKLATLKKKGFLKKGVIKTVISTVF